MPNPSYYVSRPGEEVGSFPLLIQARRAIALRVERRGMFIERDPFSIYFYPAPRTLGWRAVLGRPMVGSVPTVLGWLPPRPWDSERCGDILRERSDSEVRHA